MQICNRCVLDSHYPGISFNEEGICNYCANSKRPAEQAALRRKYELKFLEVVEQYKGKRTYDCLLAYRQYIHAPSSEEQISSQSTGRNVRQLVPVGGSKREYPECHDAVEHEPYLHYPEL
jgi:hypothetical protein